MSPHDVKHWIDPDLIPFGWGLFEEGDQVLTVEKGTGTEPKDHGLNCILPC